ncbi:diadenylate cyclase CdaA [Cytophagales bacterium LB-30]|uniref:Diadenylate cyclase n=1 Tax=Shiella aurantiaca TaxID=3058365 RepID=A0ABT8F2J9_9BACT|nr:diadenylate cyclase CdaA [Shiella aurantiaca]MDN4164677.1 diadenylate cyclase CdaA [Shiella aurantiaca]
MILLFNIGFLEISAVDMADIALVSILLYQVYKLMRGSVAVKIFLGFLSLYLTYLVVKAAEMELLSAILGQFMGVGVLAAIILFQQEIRKFLLIIGKSTALNRENIMKNFPWKRAADNREFSITPIIEAAKTLGGSNTGALIVFSKSSELKFYAESGDLIDAYVSKRLLLSIFNKNSPLHDGAAIIYRGKIKAARCILPVTEQDNLPAQFGLRHRAAIGMSEATDTLILIVSEETGQISLAKNGRILHNLSSQELRTKINQYLYEDVDWTEENVPSVKEQKKNKKQEVKNVA